MTLDEAIRFTKQALENVNPDKRVYSEFRFTVEQVKQLLEWLEDYSKVKEVKQNLQNGIKYAFANIIELSEENQKLKDVLKFAVDDFDKLANVESCYYPFCGEKCPFDCTGGCEEREWKHRDEAMKLLGGTDNAEN